MAGRLAAKSAAGRRNLVEEIRATAFKRKITYEYDKEKGEEAIRILYPPVFLGAGAVPALHNCCFKLSRACEKAFGLFLERPEAREIFPLEEEEERLMFMSNPELHANRPAIWQRLDAAMDPQNPVASLRLMETNMNSVGGVYYAPAVDALSMETVLPNLLEPEELSLVSPNDDLERLLFEIFLHHAKQQGVPVSAASPIRIAVVENDPEATGPTETAAVIEGLCALGADAFPARPDEFEIRGNELIHLGRTVDLIYRLFEIREMIGMGPAGALKTAFANHRVVSSLGGELDHKSIFELFTSTVFDRFFSPEERRLFRAHVLWTRLLRAAFTDSPDGSKVDLPEFVYHHRDRLVLKPNRSYGGEGIVIGRETDEGTWQSEVNRAMAAPRNFAVQEATPLPEIPFSVIDPDGGVIEERLNVVFGVSATPSGFGVIGRASRSRIVNVARHGGLVPVLRLS